MAVEKYRRIDVWLNNAGLVPHFTFGKLKVDPATMCQRTDAIEAMGKDTE